MGKKKIEEMKRQRDIFVYGSEDGSVEGAVKRGVPEQVAIEIFDEMEGFANYAFNKSHAAAYAVLAYQTAYLKRYHRVEFITAVLNNRITSIDEITKYINYAEKCGIKVFQPDVNKSDVCFSGKRRYQVWPCRHKELRRERCEDDSSRARAGRALQEPD